MSVKIILLLILLQLSFFSYPTHAQRLGIAEANQKNGSELYLEAGFPAWVALNIARNDPQDRKIFLLIEDQDFTQNNLQKIFTGLAIKYDKPVLLRITAFSDAEMLKRAIDISQSGFSVDFDDTPKGRRASAKWYEKYYPAPTGYFRAYYYRSLNEEEFQFSPDREKDSYIKIILKRKASPIFTPVPEPVEEMMRAIFNGDAVKIAEMIAGGMDVNIRDKYEWTPLIQAARYSKTEIIKLLLSKGADLNAQSKQGVTALHIAASQSHLEIVKILLEYGASVADIRITPDRDFPTASQKKVNNTKVLTEYYKSPLLRASEIGNTEIIKLLLSRGANVNARNIIGRTPLIEAYPYKEAIEALLDYGADIDAQDRKGWTALMHAIWDRNYESVRLMLSRGANVDIKNNDDKTAMDIAYEIGDNKMVKLLQHSKKPSQNKSSY